MKNWIDKIIKWCKKEAGKATSPLPLESPATNDVKDQPQSGGNTVHTYSSDQPIRSRVEDRFNRWAFAQRIASTLATRTDPGSLVIGLFGAWGEAPRLYWLWNKCGDGSAVQTHLRSRFEAIPAEVDNFLETFVGYAWGMESGLPHRADFDRGSYDAVAKLIEPDFIVANLKRRYGVELDTPQFHHGNETSLPRRIAHQFTYIHVKVQEENADAASQA